MTAIEKYGPNAYHVHVRFPVMDPVGADTWDQVENADERLTELVKKTPCRVTVDASKKLVSFSFYNLSIQNEEQAIHRALYVLQTTLPEGRFKSMLLDNQFRVDTDPLGL